MTTAPAPVRSAEETRVDAVTIHPDEDLLHRTGLSRVTVLERAGVGA